MALKLRITPHGRPLFLEAAPDAVGTDAPQDLVEAFTQGAAQGLMRLAAEPDRALPPELVFLRDFAGKYLARLCRTPDDANEITPIEPPADELAFLAMQAPPMTGMEYLDGGTLGNWWRELDEHVRAEIKAFAGPAQEYLRRVNPLWRLVGRVTFHLAENKRDEAHPFAFMATYTSRLSTQGRVQHLPLGRALQEYAGARDRAALVALLTPVQRASEHLPWVKELVDGGGVYQALAWKPKQAYEFLRDVPQLEASGIVVRVPNWWRSAAPSRVQVSVKVGDRASALTLDAMLDFSVDLAMDGQALSEEELRQAMASVDGLVRLRGQWVEIDRERLNAALEHWKRVEADVRRGGISFFEGMRLLSGASFGADAAAETPEQIRQWTGLAPGAWLEKTLAELRNPDTLGTRANCQASRPGEEGRRQASQEKDAGLSFRARLNVDSRERKRAGTWCPHDHVPARFRSRLPVA